MAQTRTLSDAGWVCESVRRIRHREWTKAQSERKREEKPVSAFLPSGKRIMVGPLQDVLERPLPFPSFVQSYSTLLPGLRAVKRTGAWQRPAGLSPPEDLSSCPHCLRLWLDRLFLPGKRDHCEAGCHACFWLDEYRSAPSLPFIDAGAESDAGGLGASAASLLPLVRGLSAVVVRHRI